MLASKTGIRNIVGFLATIYTYQKSNASEWSPLLFSPQQKVIFFHDFIDAEEKNEACERAIRQFWENISNYTRNGTNSAAKCLPRLSFRLPESLYIDLQPIYVHAFAEAWKHSPFVRSQERFLRNRTIVDCELERIWHRAAGTQKAGKKKFF